MTDASRKAKERASRKAKGQVRIEIWLPKNLVFRVDKILSDNGPRRYGRSEVVEEALEEWMVK